MLTLHTVEKYMSCFSQKSLTQKDYPTLHGTNKMDSSIAEWQHHGGYTFLLNFHLINSYYTPCHTPSRSEITQSVIFNYFIFFTTGPRASHSPYWLNRIQIQQIDWVKPKNPKSVPVSIDKLITPLLIRIPHAFLIAACPVWPLSTTLLISRQNVCIAVWKRSSSSRKVPNRRSSNIAPWQYPIAKSHMNSRHFKHLLWHFYLC